MSETTPRLGLYKPADDGSEPVDVATDLNDNLEKLDSYVGVVPSTSSTPPATPFDGMLTYEADTSIVKYRKASVWTQLLAKGSTFFADILVGIGQKIGIGTLTPTAVIEAVVTNITTSPTVLKFRQTSDTNPRMQIDRDGIKLGPGTGVSDVHLYRTGTQELTVDGVLFVEYDIVSAGAVASTTLSVSSDMEIGGSITSDLVVDANFSATGTGFTKIIRKVLDEGRTSTVTATIDPELYVDLPANSVWLIEAFLFMTGTTGDIKTSWNIPAGASGLKWALGPDVTATGATNVTMRVSGGGAATETSYGLYSEPFSVGAKETMMTTIGSTAGRVQLKFAQNTSTAITTYVRANSFMKVTKVA